MQGIYLDMSNQLEERDRILYGKPVVLKSRIVPFRFNTGTIGAAHLEVFTGEIIPRSSNRRNSSYTFVLNCTGF